MNTEAGRPAPPPLPGPAPEPQSKALQLMLAGALVVLLVVSITFGLVVWKLGFSSAPAPAQTSPLPEDNTATAVTTTRPILQLQNTEKNILEGDSLVIAGTAQVQRQGGYLAVSDAPNLQIQDMLTVSAWFNAPSYEQPMTVAGRSQNGPPWRYPFLSWLVRINTESLIEIDVGHAQNYTPSGWNVPTLQPNQWHFVAMTFDGRTKRLFLDGNPVTSLASGSPNSSAAIHYVPGRSILVGADESETPVGDRFRGMIDDFRLYDQALSAEEIQALFQNGRRQHPVR